MASRSLALALLSLLLAAAPIRADLIHRYSFKSGTAKDSVGSVDGNLKGAAKIDGGKLILENADKTSADADVSYLEFAGSVLPKGTSASLAVWFNGKDVGNFSRVINIGDKEAGEGRAFIYFTPNTQDGQARVAITATDAASKTNIDTDRLDDGKQHLAIIVIDGAAKKLHLFIDGKEPVAAADLGDNTLDKVRPVSNWLGRSSFDNDAGLTASIDEFRVYDNALSADEAAAIFKAGPDALPGK